MLTVNETLQPINIPAPYQMVQASTGKRFGNFLIDYIFFLLILTFWAIIAAIISPKTFEAIDDDNVFGTFGDRIIGLIAYAIIMSLIEAIFRGKSIGKLITGTKAVNSDGTIISFGKAFARGFTRAVPFELLSAFGKPCFPWHDKWTDTFVIDEKKTHLHNEELSLSSRVNML